MRVSVIIPTMNEGTYLERTLRALRNVGVHEIIVVDGGSTDNTLDVAHRMADKVLESRPSLVYDSPAKARNAGFKVSEGDVVAFVDADTVVSKTWLEGLREALKGGAVGVTGPALPLEEEGPMLVSYILSYDLLVRLTFLLGRPHMMGFNMAFRRDVFEKSGGFPEDTKVSEDALLSLRASRLGRITFSHKMLVYTSSRRVRKRGWSESVFYLIYNGLSVILLEKPVGYYPSLNA